MFVGVDDCGGAVAQTEFGEDAADVGLDGDARDDQFIGDFVIGAALGDQCQYVLFAGG